MAAVNDRSAYELLRQAMQQQNVVQQGADLGPSQMPFEQAGN
jgi:hypothetical protein